MDIESFLREFYTEKNQSVSEIALVLGLSDRQVKRRLSKFRVYRKPHFKKPDCAELFNWYITEKRGTPEIASLCNCTARCVGNWLRRCEIPIRSRSDCQSIRYRTEHITAGLLRDLYVEQKLTQLQISKRLGVSQGTIANRMEQFEISTRSISERVKGALNPMFGRTHTPEACEKIRRANSHQFSTQEARERHAILTAKQITAGKTGKTHNKLEALFASILDDLDIEYIWQYRLSRYSYDFYLPETNTIIEVHGTFWHSDPRFYFHGNLSEIQQRNTINDRRKARLARRSGYQFLRFWEHDIHNAPDKVHALLA